MIAVLVIYTLAMLFIFIYSLVQVHLVLLYLHFRKNQKHNVKEIPLVEFPFVTIQLPVYNELYVVERLIKCISEFDYPRDKLEIQVLDDSTDESYTVAEEIINEIKVSGINIHHIRRNERTGFKAGALAHGLQLAKGKFIAVFDADFLPHKNFLLKTIPHFENENIGVVQTKWEHLNENFSLLTKLQAFGLNAHFTIEQGGRYEGNHFINFNGTAGVWRKQCIIDSGGWQSDTLTEDLDLSYRAQLKGWKFVYLESVGNPAELPVAMNALKTQQFRWTKGAAECARKNLPSFLRAKNISFTTKIHGLFHLLNSGIFISIITISVLSIPLLFIKRHLTGYSDVYKYGTVFLASFILLSVSYYVSVFAKEQKALNSLRIFFTRFPFFLSLSMGLSFHNAIAAVEGYLSQKTPFIRTPKFNIGAKNECWQSNKYLISAITPVTFIEGLLAIYFLSGIVFAFYYSDYGLLPFHVMLSFGFGTVCYYSLIHSKPLKIKNG